MKACSKCKEVKDFSQFRKSSKGDKNGLHSWCYDCNRAARRKHYKDNKEEYARWNADWNSKNVEKRKGYEKKRGSRKEYWSEWRATHRNQKRAYDQNYRALRLSADGVLTEKVIEHVFLTYGHRCLQCGKKENIEIDHVIPLSLGGSNLFENLQPLCKSHNSAKGNRSSADYRQNNAVIR